MARSPPGSALPVGHAQPWPGRPTGGRSSSWAVRAGSSGSMYARSTAKRRACSKGPRAPRCPPFLRTAGGWSSGPTGPFGESRSPVGRSPSWSKACVTLPSASPVVRTDALFYDGPGGTIWSAQPERSPTGAHEEARHARCAHVLPHLLPGGRALLYTVRHRSRTWGDEEVVAHVLATGERKPLLRDAADARYVASGHLVFLRRGTLFGVGFDLARLEIAGTPVATTNAVTQALTSGHSGDMTGAGQFSVASTGVARLHPRGCDPPSRLRSRYRRSQRESHAARRAHTQLQPQPRGFARRSLLWPSRSRA